MGKKQQGVSLSCWIGMDFFSWTRGLFRHRFQVGWRRVPLAIVITFVSLGNTLLRWLEHIIYGRKIYRTKIKGDPVFVIGHWRSGTTMLHELMALDKNHTYPTTYECFVPNHFLLTERFLKPLLNSLMPARRPQDNVRVNFDSPQEDEWALCLSGFSRPFFNIAFPRHMQKNMDDYDLENLSPKKLEKWKRGLMCLLKRITFARPKFIILKSPPHTFRIKVLLEMFPQARFVHIVRDPYIVFQSTMHMWHSVFPFSLQTPDFANLENFVFEMFIRTHEKLEETRGLIPPSHFHELHYEDLVKDPIEEMRNLYNSIGLTDFESALLPALKKRFANVSLYKTNRYELTPGLQAEINRRWGKYFKRYGYSMTQ